jgi:hypothetical protein
MDSDISVLKNIIERRRSVMPSTYNGRAISRETLEAILESANHAPTHKLTQPWHFVVFRGSALEELALSCRIYIGIRQPPKSFPSARWQRWGERLFCLRPSLRLSWRFIRSCYLNGRKSLLQPPLSKTCGSQLRLMVSERIGLAPEPSTTWALSWNCRIINAASVCSIWDILMSAFLQANVRT